MLLILGQHKTFSLVSTWKSLAQPLGMNLNMVSQKKFVISPRNTETISRIANLEKLPKCSKLSLYFSNDLKIIIFISKFKLYNIIIGMFS